MNFRDLPVNRSNFSDHNSVPSSSSFSSSVSNNSEQVRASLSSNAFFSSFSSSKSKFLILSDSHGRSWSEHLGSLLGPQFSVEASVKPGANFSNVIAGISDRVANFGVRDYVIVMAGTNDSSSDYDIWDALELTFRSCSKTNLCLVEIPYRYDNPSLNPRINDVNRCIFNMYGRRIFSNVQIFDINKYVSRFDYTRHGLHFLPKSKKKICRFLVRDALTLRKYN